MVPLFTPVARDTDVFVIAIHQGVKWKSMVWKANTIPRERESERRPNARSNDTVKVAQGCNPSLSRYNLPIHVI